MINTRKTIFLTLKKRIRELTKHANLSTLEFRKIMIAVILNDLKEWSEYIPKDNPNIINKLLENYILDNCFIIDRSNTKNNFAYVNVNTPQSNTTWQRIWDKESSKTGDPVLSEAVCQAWEPDPMCDVKIIYFYTPDEKTQKTYLEETYGIYGQKLKTICDKMNIYIDRETGIAWYLNNKTCLWERVGSQIDGMTQEQVEQLISEYKINREWKNTSDGPKIEFSLVKGEADSTLNLLTKEEVEEMV